MSNSLLGIVVTGAVLLSLVVLYRYEARNGVRILGRVRVHIDFWILKIDHTVKVFVRGASRDVVRQILHYVFHRFFSFVLHVLLRFENGVKKLLRSNRTLAKRSHQERTTRNKLEEIALHKVEVALSEEEKKKRKDKMLRG